MHTAEGHEAWTATFNRSVSSESRGTVFGFLPECATIKRGNEAFLVASTIVVTAKCGTRCCNGC